MQAVRWHAPRDVRLDEVPAPSAPRGEVIVEVAACGLCGSDLHEYLHGRVDIPKRPHPLTGVMPPVTLGHEFAGRVVALGPGVGDFRPGDRVAVNPCLTCGECAWCRRGQSNLCAKLGTLGLSRDGALAPLVAVPTSGCHRLPAEVDDEQAAVVEPLAVAVHACARARLQGGERVAVIGGGAIGLLVLQVLRAKGAAFVVVVEPRAERRRLALELGADAVIDPDAEDPARTIADLNGSERIRAFCETVGAPIVIGSHWVAPPAATLPTRVPTWRIVTSSAATARSQARLNSLPPPATIPLRRAIEGLPRVRRASWHSAKRPMYFQ